MGMLRVGNKLCAMKVRVELIKGMGDPLPRHLTMWNFFYAIAAYTIR